MLPPKLSVILITRNEAANVAGCLASVAFADEWIVVDAGSTDATCEIARQAGATVVSTATWPGFGAQKNHALSLARGGWVLSIDADDVTDSTTPAFCCVELSMFAIASYFAFQSSGKSGTVRETS